MLVGPFGLVWLVRMMALLHRALHCTRTPGQLVTFFYRDIYHHDQPSASNHTDEADRGSNSRSAPAPTSYSHSDRYRALCQALQVKTRTVLFVFSPTLTCVSLRLFPCAFTYSAVLACLLVRLLYLLSQQCRGARDALRDTRIFTKTIASG